MQVPFCKSRASPFEELLLVLLVVEGEVDFAGLPLFTDFHHHRRHQPQTRWFVPQQAYHPRPPPHVLVGAL